MANSTFTEAALLFSDKIQITSKIHKTNILIIGSIKPISCHHFYFISLTYFSDNGNQTLKFGNTISGILATVDYRQRLLSIPGLSTSGLAIGYACRHTYKSKENLLLRMHSHSAGLLSLSHS